jgi:DNA-binding transcriptional LysR family regulator
MDAVAEAFARHPHVVIAAPGHPLEKAPHPARALAEGLRSQWLARAACRAPVAEHRLPLNVSMEMAKQRETIKQAVQAGMGISLLSLHTIGLSCEDAAPRGPRRSGPATGARLVRGAPRGQRRLSPVAQAFRTFLLSEARKLIPEK